MTSLLISVLGAASKLVPRNLYDFVVGIRNNNLPGSIVLLGDVVSDILTIVATCVFRVKWIIRWTLAMLVSSKEIIAISTTADLPIISIGQGFNATSIGLDH